MILLFVYEKASHELLWLGLLHKPIILAAPGFGSVTRKYIQVLVD
jgi:hypothetical protein